MTKLHLVAFITIAQPKGGMISSQIAWRHYQAILLATCVKGCIGGCNINRNGNSSSLFIAYLSDAQHYSVLGFIVGGILNTITKVWYILLTLGSIVIAYNHLSLIDIGHTLDGENSLVGDTKTVIGIHGDEQRCHHVLKAEMYIVRARLLDGLRPHDVAGLIVGSLALVGVEHVAVLLDTCFIASDIDLLLAPCLRRKHIWCGLCQIALVNIGTIRRLIVAIDIKAIGSHKLCPSISPNKTIEGFGGSLVGTTAAVAALGWFFGFPVPEMAGLGLALSIFATLGDLVESVAKRETGIKDSGNIIPGHGGVWDRFDSVLFTAPIVYYFAILVLANQ